MIISCQILFHLVSSVANMAQSAWTRSQLDQWMVTFEKSDKDKKGYLTYSNLVGVLRANGFKGNHEELKQLFLETDTNEDKKITKDEFLGCMAKVPTIDHQETAMRKAFETLDADKSGFLTKKELVEATKSGAKIDVAANKIADLLVYLSKEDDDGKINYQEFLRVWNNHRVGDAMLDVFKQLDKDGSGFLTRNELIDGVQADSVLNFRACRISDLLVYLITDKDKKIDYNEFVKVYKDQPEVLVKK